jgi:predicted enzyme related to lactoylglutathione lyase
MRLVQSRVVTDDVEGLAAFYAGLLGVSVTLNEYYVEVPAGPVTMGFSKRRFTEYTEDQPCPETGAARRDEVILDFQVNDVDAEYERVAGLGGVTVVTPPTTQPWGSRSMIFRDPGGNLVNIFSRITQGTD